MRALSIGSGPGVLRNRGRCVGVLLLVAACGNEGPMPASIARLGDPESGRRIIAQVECGVCHVVPGVAGARGNVGPSLAGFAQRRYFAGSQPNEPERLLQWILDPPSLSPSTAMPRMPVDPDQARDVVAYLYTLH